LLAKQLKKLPSNSPTSPLINATSASIGSSPILSATMPVGSDTNASAKIQPPENEPSTANPNPNPNHSFSLPLQPSNASLSNSPRLSPRSPREVVLFGDIINFKSTDEQSQLQTDGGVLVESTNVSVEYARALASLTRALELASRVLPDAHFHLAAIRIDMGQIFYRRGNYMKALGMCEN
jgi:hypothetical protein